MTRDDLSAWKDNPATKWVMEALEAKRDSLKEDWATISWLGGACDPLTLCELRSAASAFHTISEAQYEELCDWRGERPEEDES